MPLSSSVRLAAGLALLLLFPTLAHAQQDGLLQIGDPAHQFLLEQQTAGRLPSAHLTHLPLSAYEARRYLDTLDAHRDRLSASARARLDGLLGRPHPSAARLNGLAPFLYRDSSSFFSARGEDFRLEVEPLLYLTYGSASQNGPDGRSTRTSLWQNTRGVRGAGHVGRHLFFEARIEEVQRKDPRLRIDRKSAPRLTLVRESPGQVFDYQLATGVLGFRTDHFEVRFGRDRNRWGPGTGSLVLSNYAAAYDQLQIRTTVWRLQYVNLFAALTDLTFFQQPTFPDQLLPRKYAAFHRLSINLPGRLQIGAFEAVVFATDTTDARRRNNFDLTYLNPVMFYRAAEADRGSPDNVLLGGDIAWAPVPGLRLYGQLLLDELTVRLIGKKSWANKWGLLAGAHAVLPGPGLSVRAEYARLRPYLYSHAWPVTAYVHYNDGIGHPAGPNAQDLALFIDYTPTPRVRAALNLAYTERGRDTPEANYGSNPQRSYVTRVSDTGVGLPFGVRRTDWLLEARAGYELLPKLYVGGALLALSEDDALTGRSRYIAPVALVQWGLPFQSTRY